LIGFSTHNNPEKAKGSTSHIEKGGMAREAKAPHIKDIQKELTTGMDILIARAFAKAA
jgi:hypothetical protein